MKRMIEPVRIVPPQVSGLTLGQGAKVFTASGAEINGISSLTISIVPDDFITATVEVAVAFEEITAHVLLGLDSVRMAADAHGYDLVKRIEYPVSPRLKPDASGYICDECGREWKTGETSGCKPCADAL